MQFSDLPGKTFESKLLPFRSPVSPLQSLDGAPGGVPMPHDVATLRRPMTVETAATAGANREKQSAKLNELDSLAHDARNLLTSLSLMGGLLAEPGVLGTDHQHYAGDLQQVAGSLGMLIERMAAAPQIGREPVFVREPLRSRAQAPSKASTARTTQAGTVPAQREEAGPMVKSCERLLSSVAGPNVALHISYERGLGVLALCGEDLTRVLMNLVKNAGEAMPGGGRIAITVRKALGARPAALIQVEDTGAGIPAHALGQIFQAGVTSKRNTRGWPSSEHHGLGLTIVRELVESVGGTIRVSSTLKKGSHFEIKVPCHKG